MNRWTHFSLIMYFGISFLLLTSCSTREIKDLQQSVQDLDQRLLRYHQQTSIDTAETTGTLKEVNKSINDSFREIRYSQSNLESMVEQLSSRLGKVERNLDLLKERVDRIDTLAQQTANLAQDVQRSSANERQKLEDRLTALSNDMNTLKDHAESEISQAKSSIQNIHSQLSRRIDTLDESNKEIFKQILTELGAEVPKDVSTSGRVHIVQQNETLSNIAAKYDVSVQAIQDLNGITNPSLIKIGQKIRIP